MSTSPEQARSAVRQDGLSTNKSAIFVAAFAAAIAASVAALARAEQTQTQLEQQNVSGPLKEGKVQKATLSGTFQMGNVTYAQNISLTGRIPEECIKSLEGQSVTAELQGKTENNEWKGTVHITSPCKVSFSYSFPLATAGVTVQPCCDLTAAAPPTSKPAPPGKPKGDGGTRRRAPKTPAAESGLKFFKPHWPGTYYTVAEDSNTEAEASSTVGEDSSTVADGYTIIDRGPGKQRQFEVRDAKPVTFVVTGPVTVTVTATPSKDVKTRKPKSGVVKYEYEVDHEDPESNRVTLRADGSHVLLKRTFGEGQHVIVVQAHPDSALKYFVVTLDGAEETSIPDPTAAITEGPVKDPTLLDKTSFPCRVDEKPGNKPSDLVFRPLGNTGLRLNLEGEEGRSGLVPEITRAFNSDLVTVCLNNGVRGATDSIAYCTTRPIQPDVDQRCVFELVHPPKMSDASAPVINTDFHIQLERRNDGRFRVIKVEESKPGVLGGPGRCQTNHVRGVPNITCYEETPIGMRAYEGRADTHERAIGNPKYYHLRERKGKK